jgi:hypothetical protein
MARPEPPEESVQTRPGRVLRGVLAVTRRLAVAWPIGFLLLALQFVIGSEVLDGKEVSRPALHAWENLTCYLGLALFTAGSVAHVWTVQCNVCVRVLREGWHETFKSYVSGTDQWPGVYASQHCGELAGYLLRRPYRLGVFLLPYVLLLVWIVLVLVMPPEWPFG